LGNVGLLRREGFVEQLIKSVICNVLDLTVFADPETAAYVVRERSVHPIPK
jgi:hypothetical protein